jgi:hypothetical protein
LGGTKFSIASHWAVKKAWIWAEQHLSSTTQIRQRLLGKVVSLIAAAGRTALYDEHKCFVLLREAIS